MKTFKFYSDPAHGWLAVKRKLLVDLGIEKDISRYSYQHGGTVYLEEDSDASKFIVAFGKENLKFDEIFHDKRSPIRSYESFDIAR